MAHQRSRHTVSPVGGRQRREARAIRSLLPTTRSSYLRRRGGCRPCCRPPSIRPCAEQAVLPLAIEARCDVVVEGECVPGEATIRLQRRGDTFKRAAAVGPGWQVQERTERAVD